MAGNPYIRIFSAKQGAGKFVTATLPSRTQEFSLAAWKATAVVKFAFAQAGVSSITGTCMVVPARGVFTQKDIDIPQKNVYIAVTGVATSPVSLMYWL